MAHTHAGNAGDFVKHVVLADALEATQTRFGAVHYIDPYAGQGLYHRPPKLFIPPADHPAYDTFRRYQIGLPQWYMGSPLIAAAALAGSNRSSLTLSDNDGDAVVTLAGALASPLLEKQVAPELPHWRCEAAISVAVGQYEPARLPLRAGGDAANVVLLDPTHDNYYSELITQSVHVCRDSGTNVLMLAWGLEDWRLVATVRSQMAEPLVAGFEDSGGCYQVVLMPFGPSEPELRGIAAAACGRWRQ